MIEKIVSGGQTGVDRAALDAAMTAGLPCGGWCPKGRMAEDGVIDGKYPLAETPAYDFSQRTEWNVRDSDGTLILAGGELSGGTAYTEMMARRHNRPLLIINPHDIESVAAVRDWAERAGVRVLNVAGPRASKEPGIYKQAVRFLTELLKGQKRTAEGI
jgi:predicted Rossmann-fold nucleotide-binding protein